MKRAQLGNKALRDLDDIWDYIAEHNEAAADRAIRAIGDTIKRLTRDPGFGEKCDRLQAGLRRFPVQRHPYVVFYVTDAEGIEVVRVLDGRRNADAQFHPS